MDKEIVLHSPASAESLTFKWSLTSPNDILATMKFVEEDLPGINYALQQNILRDYDPNNYDSMKCVCDKFNKVIKVIVTLEKGTSLTGKRIVKEASTILLTHILKNTYYQTIEYPEKLNHCVGFSPQVYGEVSYELMREIMNRLNLISKDVFVDLGSGVGHLVLQMAASNTCKMCYGIEIVELRSQYADNMSKTFQSWMNWYGKKWGPYELKKGDFLSIECRKKILSASIIFVNNFSFGPIVDHQLKEIFSELKDGTRIISTKQFCPINLRVSERNMNDFGAITHVIEFSNLQGNVSWTSKPIPIYVHIIDRKKLSKYFEDKKKMLVLSNVSENRLELNIKRLTASDINKKYFSPLDVLLYDNSSNLNGYDNSFVSQSKPRNKSSVKGKASVKTKRNTKKKKVKSQFNQHLQVNDINNNNINLSPESLKGIDELLNSVKRQYVKMLEQMQSFNFKDYLLSEIAVEYEQNRKLKTRVNEVKMEEEAFLKQNTRNVRDNFYKTENY